MQLQEHTGLRNTHQPALERRRERVRRRAQLVKTKTRLNQQMQGGSSLTRQPDDDYNWR